MWCSFFVSPSSNPTIILCVITMIRPLYMPLRIFRTDLSNIILTSPEHFDTSSIDAFPVEKSNEPKEPSRSYSIHRPASVREILHGSINIPLLYKHFANRWLISYYLYPTISPWIEVLFLPCSSLQSTNTSEYCKLTFSSVTIPKDGCIENGAATNNKLMMATTMNLWRLQTKAS